MARVEVVGDRLSIQIEGMDRVWSLKSRLGIPLAHVPGVLMAGSFHLQADRVLGDVRDAAQTVAAIRKAFASTGSR